MIDDIAIALERNLAFEGIPPGWRNIYEHMCRKLAEAGEAALVAEFGRYPHGAMDLKFDRRLSNEGSRIVIGYASLTNMDCDACGALANVHPDAERRRTGLKRCARHFDWQPGDEL